MSISLLGDVMTENSSRDVSRRTIAKGAAWAVPAVAFAAAAPAMASSPQLPPVRLDGWMDASRDSRGIGRRKRCVYQRNACGTGIPGRRYGMYVTNAEIDSVEGASVTFWMPREGDWSEGYSAYCNTDGWSLPRYIGTERGYYLYESTYTGGYQDCSSIYPGDVCLIGRPAFVFTTRDGWCSNLGRERYSAITRTVVVNGEKFSFTRTLNYADSSTDLGLPPENPPYYPDNRSAETTINRSAETEDQEAEKLPEVKAAL